MNRSEAVVAIAVHFLLCTRDVVKKVLARCLTSKLAWHHYQDGRRPDDGELAWMGH